MESEDRKRKADGISPASTTDQGTTTTTAASASSSPPDKEKGDNNVKRAKVSLDSSSSKVVPVQVPKEGSKDKTDSPKKEEEEKQTETEVDTKDAHTTSEGATTKDDSSSTANDTITAKTSTDDTKEKEATKDEKGSDRPEDKKTIFGSSVGFSGFGSVKPSGFGLAALGSGTKSSGFGNGGTAFGSPMTNADTTTSTLGSFNGGLSSSFGGSTLGFGSAKGFGELKGTSGSLFGAPATTEKKPEEEKEETITESNSTDNIQPVVELPTDYEARTGEEDEVPLFQARCKTHRLVPAKSKEQNANMVPPPAAAKSAPAVPHSDSFLGKSSSGDGAHEPEIVWQEVGIGPLKVLRHDTSKKIRIVQRREVSPSGPATKVIVNAPLHSGSLTKIHQPTEKHVQWTTPVDGKATTYLFKFGSPADASHLKKVLLENQDSANSSL